MNITDLREKTFHAFYLDFSGLTRSKKTNGERGIWGNKEKGKLKGCGKRKIRDLGKKMLRKKVKRAIGEK